MDAVHMQHTYIHTYIYTHTHTYAWILSAFRRLARWRCRDFLFCVLILRELRNCCQGCWDAKDGKRVPIIKHGMYYLLASCVVENGSLSTNNQEVAEWIMFCGT